MDGISSEFSHIFLLQAKAVDLLHKAAYHSGLGNSLFCAEHRVGKISAETVSLK
jgi:hypothetical protein